MKSLTLFSYLALKFLKIIFLTSLALGMLVFLIDIMEEFRKVAKIEELPGYVALQLAFYKIPNMQQTLAPFSVLLGTMIAFSTLTKQQEITALRAAGIPARSFLVPALCVCIAIGLTNVTILSQVSSVFLKKYEWIESIYFPGDAKGLITKEGSIWLRQPENGGYDTFLYAKQPKPNGIALQGVTLIELEKFGTFIRRIDADSMVYTRNYWALTSGQIIDNESTITPFTNYSVFSALTPEIIQNSFNSPQTFSLWQLYEYITILKAADIPSAKYEMHFQRLLSSPLLIIAMFLLATPFALRFSRGHNLGSVILVGLGLGFSFYLFSNFIAAYGLAGRLNLYLAAWLPTIIATLVSLTLFIQFREE